MGLLDKIFGIRDNFNEPSVEEIVARKAARLSFKPQRERRETTAAWEQHFYWLEGTISRGELRNSQVMENLRLIRDLNPDASMAIWNFLRLGNSGHELEALKQNGKADKRGTEILNELAARVGSFYGGGADQLINVLLLTAYTQGAIALEVELSENVKDVVDFHAVDPSSLEWKNNKETGELELVQKQSTGDYKVLNQDLVFYIPLDPDIADPYGRSPILPVLQIIFFQIEVLKDLKKVIHHQGYQRFDIKIMETAILDNMPDEIKHQGPEAVADYVTSYIDDIRSQMETLGPDDDFYHTDSVAVDMAGGAVGSSMDATKVIDIVNQQIVTSLKQLPILLGRNEGSTETHSTVQWQIYVRGIESMQRMIKRVLEKAYNVSLRVYGLPLRSHLSFDALQVTDREKDANAERTETETKIKQVQQGWISNDEAAMKMVGHNAAGEPEPIGTGLLRNEPVVDDRKKKVPGINRKDEDFEIEAGDEIGKVATNFLEDSSKAFNKRLKDQVNTYIERLEKAPDVPTRALLDIDSLRSIKREETPYPSWEFEKWVKVNILTDSADQMELWDELGRDWISQAAAEAGQATLDYLETAMVFNERNETLLRWLQERSLRTAQLIQGVNDERVLMNLWDTVYEGQYSIEKLAKNLREDFAFSKERSRVIARTETITATRAGQFHGDKQSGMVIGKKWRAALQDRTREGHREADGQVVPLDEPFYVANAKGQVEPLLFPGDSSLGSSASNTIQCRCWYKRILEGEEM